jgi:hypothetical protein
MKARWMALALGATFALGMVGPAAAQDWWPAYGNYGYGTGFDNPRNPYGYPRATYAQGRSGPQDDWALYGGYMPNTYYTGPIYVRENAMLFPSGRAYCQTAGSYLYCSDVASGGGQLMSLREETSAVRASLDYTWLGNRNNEVLGGVLSTRTVGNQTQLVGSLEGPNGQAANIDCTGPLVGRNAISLTCR